MAPATGDGEPFGRDDGAPWRTKGNKKWPGLPRGVKFEPSDEELMWHLIAEIGEGDAEPHPFISEFIVTLDEDETLPHKLPGVKKDGSLSYFFRRSLKSDDNGRRKRRKIVNYEFGTANWHTVGETKPVFVDGIQRGSKKILVLYATVVEGKKPKRTNWVMHQYHTGMGEEAEGELFISKIFYQMKSNMGGKNVCDLPVDTVDTVEADSIESERNGVPSQETCRDIQVEESNAFGGCRRAANDQLSSIEDLKEGLAQYEIPLVSQQGGGIQLGDSCEPEMEDFVMHNNDPNDTQSSEKTYCKMASEGEASKDMLSESHTMVHTQANTGSSYLMHDPKITCQTTEQREADFCTSNMLDHSGLSDHATKVKIEPSNHMQENPCNEVLDNIFPAATGISELCETESDEVNHVCLQNGSDETDHVKLKELYNLMLSNMNYDFDSHPNLEYNQDSGVPEGHLGTSISALENASSCAPGNNLSSTEETIVWAVKDEMQPSDALFLHEESHANLAEHVDTPHLANPLMDSHANLVEHVDTTHLANPLLDSPDCAVDHLQSPSILSDASSNSVQSDKDQGEEGGIFSLQVSAPVVRLPVISEDPDNTNGKSQPGSSSTFSVQIKSEPLEENLVNNNYETNVGCSSEKNAEKDQPNNDGELVAEKNAEEHSCSPEVDFQTSNRVISSVPLNCTIRPKLEAMESGLLDSGLAVSSNVPDIDILRANVKGEYSNEFSTDFIDHVPLRRRMEMLACMVNPLKTVPPLQECGPSKVKNARTSHGSVKRKRKKTATDSVETALEEDAPGLLQVLLDKGINVEEIKLYGNAEDDLALPICSSEDSFEELENIMSKLFSEGPSIFKFPSIRQIKGAKAVYCLACLISLIEQTRYLQFRQSPVEWGWCRDLQSFIFVFEKHNRIVLERPEYGYATYFFEFVESLPVNWQIKRLVTAMKLPCCSRTVLLENKPLLVGEDLTEGEACVMEEYGWARNTGLGTMLNYCDRVVHDRRNERYSIEWRAKIGKLLMRGHDSGRIVLSDLPKKAAEYMECRSPEPELETYSK